MHLSSQVSHHYLYSFMDIVLKEQHSSRTQEQADERTSTSRATESKCECHRWLPPRWSVAPRRRLAPSGIRLGLLRAAPRPRPRSAHNTRPEETVGHQEKKELEKRKPVSLRPRQNHLSALTISLGLSISSHLSLPFLSLSVNLAIVTSLLVVRENSTHL